MAAPIDHVIVVMLENRSFDHMLGFLVHPDERLDGLGRGGPFQNPGWGPGAGPVAASPTAKHVLPADPDHSHDSVMRQLAIKGRGARRTATLQGFVDSFERKGRNLAPPQFDGLLAPLVRLVGRLQGPKAEVTGRGRLIMQCQPPEHVPVLARLALEFGVCTRWFASVPGETWPNRNFVHAATSDGTTDIETRLYTDPTIFELLEQHGRSWRIYHDDTPQAWAFEHLWDTDERRANWFRSSEFAHHVEAGDLPEYTFIEPNHRPPVHCPPYGPVGGEVDRSSSQHPGNNRVADADYDAHPSVGDGDFARGETLLADIYEALRANPALFARSLLVVTYDEHGGFYDHVPPPMGVPGPGDPVRPGAVGWLVAHLLQRKCAAFDFTMLGVRVPSVVISPRVPRATVDDTVRDHASVPATVRALFAPQAEPLTRRDAWSPPFHGLASLDQPRTDLPDLSAHCSPPSPGAAGPDCPPRPLVVGPEPPAPDHHADMVALAELVDQRLPGPMAPPDIGPRSKGAYVTCEFDEQAHESRARRAEPVAAR